MGEALDAGRRCFAAHAWGAAHAHLSAADRDEGLGPEDLERLAIAAHLLGLDEDSVATWARAHRACLEQGDARRAARCAFWLTLGFVLRGEAEQAGGWLLRGRHLVEGIDDGSAGVEQGLLLLPLALAHLEAGDATAALAEFGDALATGVRHGDADLAALGRLGHGQALVLAGRHDEGVAELDEVMVAVTAGEVSPVVAGLVYCAVIEQCHRTFDVRRAQTWTAALSRWCADQPDLVAYRAQCRLHRAEILQLQGAWPDAMDEAERALEQLARPPTHPAVGAALYRLGELLRLRGELGRAEDAYRRASEHGHDPQPGLARLRVAQGRTPVAVAAIHRAAAEATEGVARAPLLAALVEILLAAEDLDGARTAAGELAAIAGDVDAPVLRAVSSHARGLVLLAEGDPTAALAVLRPAWVTWRDLDAPYEAARVRVALGAACQALGDADGERLELEAAATAFRALGAATDLAALDERGACGPPDAGGRLSPREREVLALVATGRTNRAVAAELVISERTVARHLANIFTKLGLSSRSAATAYAYEHGLADAAYTDLPTRRRP